MVETRVGRTSQIVSSSTVNFEEAIKNGFRRAAETLRGISGVRIDERRISVEDDQIQEYRVRMEFIFVLED